MERDFDSDELKRFKRVFKLMMEGNNNDDYTVQLEQIKDLVNFS